MLEKYLQKEHLSVWKEIPKGKGMKMFLLPTFISKLKTNPQNQQTEALQGFGQIQQLQCNFVSSLINMPPLPGKLNEKKNNKHMSIGISFLHSLIHACFQENL